MQLTQNLPSRHSEDTDWTSQDYYYLDYTQQANGGSFGEAWSTSEEAISAAKKKLSFANGDPDYTRGGEDRYTLRVWHHKANTEPDDDTLIWSEQASLES